MLQLRNCKIPLLAALLIGTVGSAFAWENCGTNLEYEIDGTVLHFRSPDPMLSADIENSKFKDNTTITSFTLPDNVSQIGSQAFMGCTALSKVELSNVQNISTYAFKGCTSLNDVVIPPTVTNIGVHAFNGCSALVSVLCRPQTAPDLGSDAFTACNSGLQICVPALGGDPGYGSKPNWVTYKTNGLLSLCYLDENDDQSTAEGKIMTFRDIQSRTEIDIFRTLRKAGCFNTMTLPLSASISGSPLDGDNVEVYEFVSATVSDGALQLNITPLAGSTLTAGTPYLIQWTNTGEVLNRMHFSGITWDSNQTADDAGTEDVTYHGFYGKTHIEDDANHSNLFLKGNNTLYWPLENDASSMLGFRAYFHVNTSSPSPAPIYRGMPAKLRIVSTPTDIHPVQSDNVQCTKELRDGQIIIIRNGESFSITGQRL